MKFIPLPQYGGPLRHISEFTNAEEALSHAEAVHAGHVEAHEKYVDILGHNKIVVDHYNTLLSEAGFTTPVAAPSRFVSPDVYPILLSWYERWTLDCQDWDATMETHRKNSELIQRVCRK